MRWATFFPLAFAAAASAADSVLYPINPLTFEAALSGQSVTRRSSDQYADLAPSTQAQLAYGTTGTNGSLLLANMTLTAPSGLPIVMMERLEGLTTAVDCSIVGDGTLSVTWKDNATYYQALQSWNWVNENSTNQFLMVVNSDGCGEDSQRVAYRVTDVDTNETSLVTTLTAEVAPWKNITGTFEMDFGKVVLRPAAAARLKKRDWNDFWDGVKDGTEELWDGVKNGTEKVVKDGLDDLKESAADIIKQIEDIFANGGDGTLGEAVEFDVSGGEAGVTTNIFTDTTFSPAALTIDCTNCFIAGKLELQGSVKVENFVVKDFTISLAPSNFSATAEITTTIAASFSKDELYQITKTGSSSTSLSDLLNLDGSIDLIEIPVPGAGVVIPEIFSLGLVASVEAGFTMGFKGDLSFTAGVTASLPDTASIELDLTDISTSSATGWDGAKAEPTLELNNSSASINATLYVRPTFGLTAEIASVGELSAKIKVGLPELSAEATVEYNTAGVCGDSTQTTAVEFGLGGVLDVVVEATAEVLGQGTSIQKTLASVNLFDPIEKCLPFNISDVLSAVEGLVVSGSPVSTANASSPTIEARSTRTLVPVKLEW